MSIEDYKTGCKYCQHLMNMGQGNYRCVEIMYDDETPIYHNPHLQQGGVVAAVLGNACVELKLMVYMTKSVH